MRCCKIRFYRFSGISVVTQRALYYNSPLSFRNREAPFVPHVGVVFGTTRNRIFQKGVPDDCRTYDASSRFTKLCSLYLLSSSASSDCPLSTSPKAFFFICVMFCTNHKMVLVSTFQASAWNTYTYLIFSTSIAVSHLWLREQTTFKENLRRHNCYIEHTIMIS